MTEYIHSRRKLDGCLPEVSTVQLTQCGGTPLPLQVRISVVVLVNTDVLTVVEVLTVVDVLVSVDVLTDVDVATVVEVLVSVTVSRIVVGTVFVVTSVTVPFMVVMNVVSVTGCDVVEIVFVPELLATMNGSAMTRPTSAPAPRSTGGLRINEVDGSPGWPPWLPDDGAESAQGGASSSVAPSTGGPA